MKFETVMKSDDLAPGMMTGVTVSGKDLLLANVDGSYFAITRKCTHMGADLCKGTLVGQTVVCARHGASFDLANGQPVLPAKVLFLKMTPKAAQSFPVKVEGGQILIAV